MAAPLQQPHGNLVCRGTSVENHCTALICTFQAESTLPRHQDFQGEEARGGSLPTYARVTK